MQITMLTTRCGSEDGFAVKRFHEGQTLEVADSLASSFIRSGAAMASVAQQENLNNPFSKEA